MVLQKRTGKKKLYKADLEGPAFNLVKAFHKNSVFLQYQMDECHKLLTNKVDMSNPEGHQILQNIYEPMPLGGHQSAHIHAQSRSLPRLWLAKNLVPSLWVDSWNAEYASVRNRVGDLQLGIESYQTKINLERPNWDAADYYFKEDYTIVPKPRAVVYRDRNDQRKLMRLNELHKFSDGTLTRVMEKLDQMVKDFHLFEYNKEWRLGMW
ncbi:hypothetical protein Tco_1072465 [Tanacetum coccineum]